MSLVHMQPFPLLPPTFLGSGFGMLSLLGIVLLISGRSFWPCLGLEGLRS